MRPMHPSGSAAPPPRPSALALLTVGCRVTLALGQVCPQDGIVEAVEVGGHAVVALVIVEHLEKHVGLREARETARVSAHRAGGRGTGAALYLGHPSYCDLPYHRRRPGTEGGWDGLLDVTKGDGSISVQDVGGDDEARQPSPATPCSRPPQAQLTGVAGNGQM